MMWIRISVRIKNIMDKDNDEDENTDAHEVMRMRIRIRMRMWTRSQTMRIGMVGRARTTHLGRFTQCPVFQGSSRSGLVLVCVLLSRRRATHRINLRVRIVLLAGETSRGSEGTTTLWRRPRPGRAA